MAIADYKVPSIEEVRKNFNEWMKSPELESLLNTAGENCKKKGLIRDFAVDTTNGYTLLTHIGKTLICLNLVENHNSELNALSYYQSWDPHSKKDSILHNAVKRTPEAVTEFFEDTLSQYNRSKGYDWSFLPD